MYPKATELRKLERDTLRCISQIGEFGRLGELQAGANAAINSINELRGPIDVHLGFTLDIRLREDRRRDSAERRVDIGALVEVSSDQKEIANASYSLIICKKQDPTNTPILRKLHFDYESPTVRNAGEPKPAIHMQVCGKLSQRHLTLGYSEQRLNALYPRFEKPRIPVSPTSIALMLNWLLLEFQSDVAAPLILRNPRWRSLVAAAERIVLRPYYESAASFLGSAQYREKRFLQSHLYQMTLD